MKLQIVRAIMALLLSLLLPLRAQALPFTFTLSAVSAISGQPGQTVGWSYQLVNTDPSYWFVPTQLSVSSFSLGSPDASYFDFPILAPGATADAVFDEVLHTGLYGVQIYPFALPGQTDTGVFTLTGEWWAGNPLTGGLFLQVADAVQVPLTLAVVGVTALPLPDSLALLALGLVLLLSSQRRRQKGAQFGLGLG